VILLDSDHISVLIDVHQASRAKLLQRLDQADDRVQLPIAVVEEQLRGWLAEIHRKRDVHKQIVPYLRLAKLIDFFGDWPITDWSEPAADVFVGLRKRRIRIGTQDLKIASIAIANEGLLLSANLRDFEQVPDLRVEDWIH
jgi:tRNA(fMet)-specific endonuclease VapC